jgi:mRNA-degrading endonuclease YafQ of YafQ-DinJ toxin-antitoxin module
LIKTLADQLKPLHETSRRHATQIEEISSGINVLAELLKFTNRNRSHSLADALHAM